MKLFVVTRGTYEYGMDLEEIVYFTASKETDWRVKLFFYNTLEVELFFTNEQYDKFTSRLLNL